MSCSLLIKVHSLHSKFTIQPNHKKGLRLIDNKVIVITLKVLSTQQNKTNWVESPVYVQVSFARDVGC